MKPILILDLTQTASNMSQEERIKLRQKITKQAERRNRIQSMYDSRSNVYGREAVHRGKLAEENARKTEQDRNVTERLDIMIAIEKEKIKKNEDKKAAGAHRTKHLKPF